MYIDYVKLIRKTFYIFGEADSPFANAAFKKDCIKNKYMFQFMDDSITKHSSDDLSLFLLCSLLIDHKWNIDKSSVDCSVMISYTNNHQIIITYITKQNKKIPALKTVFVGFITCNWWWYNHWLNKWMLCFKICCNQWVVHCTIMHHQMYNTSLMTIWWCNESFTSCTVS